MAPRQTPATYFLTSATSNRRRLFQSPTNQKGHGFSRAIPPPDAFPGFSR